MKKIVILTTGGTISSVMSNEGLIPSNSNIRIENLVKSYDDVIIDIKEVMVLDSSNIQPEEWKIIASSINENMENYDGIIITHGTDTMAYTTSMMSFMIQNPTKPIVFTGSQLPITNPLTDAISNLRDAIAMALSSYKGIYLAFDRKIILGCRAVKVRTKGFKAFESINSEPLGYIDSQGLNIRKYALPKFKDEYLFDDTIDTNVFLLKLTPATNPNIIDFLIQSNIKGIIIEAYGSGGMSFIRRDFISKIKKAREANIIVVVTSQCLYEKADFSIYQVGTKVKQMGVIEALDMTTEAVITKLMWALGKSSDIKYIKKVFKTNIANEISPV